MKYVCSQPSTVKTTQMYGFILDSYQDCLACLELFFVIFGKKGHWQIICRCGCVWPFQLWLFWNMPFLASGILGLKNEKIGTYLIACNNRDKTGLIRSMDGLVHFTRSVNVEQPFWSVNVWINPIVYSIVNGIPDVSDRWVPRRLLLSKESPLRKWTSLWISRCVGSTDRGTKLMPLCQTLWSLH